MGTGESSLQVRLGVFGSVKLWFRGGVPALVILAFGLPTFAQDTELHSCLPDSNTCSELEAIPIPDGCGDTFYLYHGRISWPALRAVGPITVSVQTYRHQDTYFPLYVEFQSNATSTVCNTSASGGHVLLETRGSAQCGGLWTSVGPIDIINLFGITPGSLYRIRVGFLQGPPDWFSNAPALHCIQVTSEAPSPVAQRSWGNFKALYK